MFFFSFIPPSHLTPSRPPPFLKPLSSQHLLHLLLFLLTRNLILFHAVIALFGCFAGTLNCLCFLFPCVSLMWLCAMLDSYRMDCYDEIKKWNRLRCTPAMHIILPSFDRLLPPPLFHVEEENNIHACARAPLWFQVSVQFGCARCHSNNLSAFAKWKLCLMRV